MYHMYLPISVVGESSVPAFIIQKYIVTYASISPLKILCEFYIVIAWVSDTSLDLNDDNQTVLNKIGYNFETLVGTSPLII